MTKFNLFISLFSAASILASCSNQDTFTIHGTVKGQDGKTIYLQRFEKNEAIIVDSTIIGTDGEFTIDHKLPGFDYYQLSMSPENAMIFVGDSVGELSFVAEETLQQPKNVEGQADTKEIYRFADEFKKILATRDSLMTLGQAGMPQEELIQKVEAWKNSTLKFLHDYVDKNVGSPAAQSALNNLNPVIDLPYFEKVYNGLKVKMAKSDYLVFLKMQIDRAGEQAGMMKRQQEAMAENDQKLPVGSLAPAIAEKDVNGKVRSLAEFRGKVVLIDFWASWCGPCRQENPNVVNMYKQFHNKGFEIFSVSLDKAEKAWKGAIAEDDLTWTHVSDLKFWDSKPAADYGVKSIPFTVLIDKEGKIIAKNLRGAALEAKLKEILG